MKKIFIVLCVVLVCSLAANAAPKVWNVINLGYCDFFTGVTMYTPQAGTVPKVFVYATHDFMTNCGYPYNTATGGFKHALTKTVPPFVTPVLDLSDPIEGMQGLPWSLQYLIQPAGLTAGATSCTWANYYSDGTGQYAYLYGSCSQSRPTTAGLPPSTVRK